MIKHYSLMNRLSIYFEIAVRVFKAANSVLLVEATGLRFLSFLLINLMIYVRLGAISILSKVLMKQDHEEELIISAHVTI